MLRSLTIRDYALISHAELVLPEGFSVITGETGAGKSILLGALSLLLGGRGDARSIRPGAKKCIVEGVFSIAEPSTRDLLASWDVETEDDEIIVRREVSQTGKSRAFLNDTPTSLGNLKELGARLIDIHSQHQNLLLTGEGFLLNTVDTIADNAALRSTYADAFRAWREARADLAALRQRAEEERREADYVQYQYNILHEAHIEKGEEALLENERQTLAHAEEIRAALSESEMLLDSGEVNVATALREASRRLAAAAEHYPPATEWAERLDSARIELDDLAASLSQAASHVESDPARLAFVEERLSLFYTLAQKFHVSSADELLPLLADFGQRIESIGNLDADLAEAEKRLADAEKSLHAAAENLTESRQQAARKVETSLTEALASLGMPYADIAFRIERRAEAHESGLDAITMLFSANPGVAPRPCGEIASGGEVARLMLALKSLICAHRSLPTIIFDEVDTGTSGTMAERMAVVMQRMSRTTQVLCITHLPQIAARATTHFRVYKDASTETTETHLTPALTEAERIDELSAMLSGQEVTDAAVENARALLAAAARDHEI